MESQARGGTRWKRFAVVMVPSVAATAAIGVALAQGALAASFSVSGQQFKVSADLLKGKGFVQYGTLDTQ
ncbi:cholesterol esterase, partial [Streptomyces sp. 2MCAF27]